MERGQIQALRADGVTQRAIARRLNRSPSTVCRELARNRTSSGRYDAGRAHNRYEKVRRSCRRTTSLSYLPLRRYLFDKMNEGWSPEQVSGRLWHDFPGQPRMRVSHETIYRSLYADEKLGRALIGCLRQRRPRRRRRGERRPTRPFIPNRIGIEARPPQVDTRERYGDWEGDLLVGANQRGAVLTLVERKSLFLRAALLPSRHAHGAAQAVIDQLQAMPPHWRRTITFDNGSEFAHHERMAAALGVETYFAHPYAAHERGTNENTNGLLRQYLPKSTDFTQITEQQLQSYVRQLNERPRKKLGYRTPSEVFEQNTVALEP
jgi:IS30 family transposase